MAVSVTARGTAASNAASSTTYAFSPASNFAAGSLAVIVISADNSASAGSSNNISSVTDSLGNTWTKRNSAIFDNGAASAGVQGAIFDTEMLAGTITTGTTITITFADNTTAKSYALWQLSSAANTRPIHQSNGTQAGATTASPSYTTASITNGDCVVAGIAGEAGTTQTHTADADTTNGSWSSAQYSEVGSTTSGNIIASQCKVVTATATQTYNPTFGLSQDSIAMYAVYRETSTTQTLTVPLLTSTSALYAPTITQVYPYGEDAFTRSTSPDDAGTADVGGDYTETAGSNDIYTDGSTLVMEVATGFTEGVVELRSVNQLDTYFYFEFKADKVPVGGSLYPQLSARVSAGFRDTSYNLEFEITGTPEPKPQWRKFVGGAQTNIGTGAENGRTFTANEWWAVRAEITGTSPTLLKAKVWRVADGEPGAWDSEESDSQAGLQDAGWVGFAFGVGGGSQGDVVFNVDNFTTQQDLSGAQTLTIPLLTSTSALYAPTVIPGPVSISLGLLDAGPALYAPTLVGKNTISLGLIDAGPALYAPTLIQDQFITLPLLDAGPALYAPTIMPDQFITLGLLDSGPALYAPTVTSLGGLQSITLGLLESTPALYAPTLTPKNTLTLGLIDAGPALYAPTIVGKNTISLGLLTSTSALYAPTLTAKNTISLSLLDSGPALYAPTLVGKNTISLGLLDAVAALYAPTLVGKNTLVLSLIDSGPALYAPTLSGTGPQTVVLTFLDSGPALFPPTVEIAVIDLGERLSDLLLRQMFGGPRVWRSTHRPLKKGR